MFDYLILGIVQGITEFIPVSSSGHLIIFQKLLGVSEDPVVISVVFHLATACALAVFFFREIAEVFSDRERLFFIVVVTLVTGVIGLLGKDFFESLFSSVRVVAVGLLITGSFLLLTKRIKNTANKRIGLQDAMILGLAQACAIVPGISRSGATITTLMFRKFERIEAFQLSFLVSLPAIVGAALFETRKIASINRQELPGLGIGFLASFVSGLCALWVLKAVVRRGKLYYFGFYCIFVALILLLFVR